MTRATAFAPATVANVAVGFDVLGFALAVAGDTVTVERRAAGSGPPVTVETIGADVPDDPARNTASVAVEALRRAAGDDGSFHVRVEKGIPLGSGMGGSAASAVGAVVAANALLDAPHPLDALLPCAVAGEAVASGGAHADNVAPCLFGGLVACLPAEPGATSGTVLALPVPAGVQCVLVRPEVRIDTRDARAALDPAVTLAAHAEQSAWLVAFVTALHRGDLALLQRSMRDVIVGPQRALRIPGFDAARAAAIDAGAIGCAIAGSGPSVFAWTTAGAAAAVCRALEAALSAGGATTRAWTGPVGGAGATLRETT